MKIRNTLKLLEGHSLQELVKKVINRASQKVYSKNMKQSVELNYLKRKHLLSYRMLTNSLTHSSTFGAAEYMQFTHTFEPRYLMTLQDATVDTKTGSVFLGNQSYGFQLLEFSSEWPKESVISNLVLPKASQIQSIDSASLGLPDINYFHLMTHWVGNVIETTKSTNPILLTPASHPLSREIIALYGLPHTEADVRWVRVRNLSLINTSRLGYLHPTEKSIVTKLIEDCQRNEIDLYISRKRSSRSLPGEAFIEAKLIEKGFQVVYCEDLDLLAQMKLFAKARNIVAPHGAGIVNGIFSREGTRIIEIMPSFRFNKCYEWQSSICNQQYSRVVYEKNSSPNAILRGLDLELSRNA
jgi:hypothetical protein